MPDESVEPIEIVGVVQPPGAGGGKSGNEELWSLILFVQPWKHEGGLLDSRKLRLVQDGFTNDQLRQSMASIKPYSVMRALVRLFEPRPNTLLSAKVLDVRNRDDRDTELHAIASEQQKPIVLTHPLLGQLTFDRGQNSFQTKLMLAGVPIEVSIDAAGEAPDPAALSIAERFWKDHADWDHRLREFAAAQLIELKNDTWLQEDEKPLTEAEFIKKLIPNSMGFDPPDGFTIYYDDGDIFWGHAIEIRGTLSKGPQSADIAG
ncbi:MAG: DUF2262 domain-containing protein [Pirellulaceae bacterium]|nr:DUF2262 domain-containing protein [Pirellulaceae bacterium]